MLDGRAGVMKTQTAFERGEFVLAKIATQWNKNNKSVSAAVTAAGEIGRAHVGNMVAFEQAITSLERGFKVRLIDERHWLEVYGAFQNGRASAVTYADLHEQYFSVPANANFIEPTVFEWADPAKIPVRDWLYGKHLIRRHVSATIASGAVGKTSLKIVEALALVTGKGLLGYEVPKKPLNVWLFNLEDDMTELRRRVSAAMIHYNIKPEDIGDRLHIDGEKSLLITKTDHRGTTINVPVVDAIVEAIQALEIDVLIVDPFISSHDAAESDSGAMDLVMKSGWVRVARDGNCAVELCHHTTKSDASSGMATAMSGRGSGAVVFACRSVMVLNPMSADEAKEAGLASPSGYFSAKDDKQNLTLKTGLRDWYKMESVSLGNGGKGKLASLRADSIGVVTRWHWPTNTSFTEDVTADQLQEIKNWLKVGEHRKDNQSTDWAGYVVGKVLGLGTSKDKMASNDKRRITRMLESWLADGHLREFSTKVDGHKRAFLTGS
jgi:hypothetical protein